MSKRKVAILSAVRTPIGTFGGMFTNVKASNLGVYAVNGAIKKANVPKEKRANYIAN